VSSQTDVSPNQVDDKLWDNGTQCAASRG